MNALNRMSLLLCLSLLYAGPEKKLLQACRNGHTILATSLISKPAINLNYVEDGDTPLLAAVKGSFFKIVHSLLTSLANPDCVDSDGNTPLLILTKRYCEKDCTPEVQKELYALILLLLKHRATVDCFDTVFDTPLLIAARRGQEDLIELFLKYGANYSLLGGYITAPVLAAMAHSHKGVQMLLEAGADVDQLSKVGTLLDFAVGRDDIELAILALSFNADPNKIGMGGKTPLHLAASLKRKAMVELLQKRGGDINASDYCGETALIAIAKQRRGSFIPFLLDCGASVECEAAGGVTAFDHYDQFRREEAAKLARIELLCAQLCPSKKREEIAARLKERQRDDGKLRRYSVQ